MTIENAGSIMKIGNNVFANSEFSNIIANFTGIQKSEAMLKLAKTGGTNNNGKSTWAYCL